MILIFIMTTHSHGARDVRQLLLGTKGHQGFPPRSTKKSIDPFFTRLGVRMGGKSPRVAKKFYRALIEEMVETLRKEQIVRLPGFGDFLLSVWKGRTYNLVAKTKRLDAKGYFPDTLNVSFKADIKLRNYFRALTRQIQREWAIQKGEDPDLVGPRKIREVDVKPTEFEDSYDDRYPF